MKFLLKSVVAATLVFGLMSVNAPSADAGLFAKLFKKKCGCCEPEPVCCEPEPEPVCCEPAPEPVCCEPAPEPTCCEPEPAPEPSCCEPAPEPACCATIYSLPPLAEGEILISISPIAIPSGAGVSRAPMMAIPNKPVTLVAVRSSTIR